MRNCSWPAASSHHAFSFGNGPAYLVRSSGLYGFYQPAKAVSNCSCRWVVQVSSEFDWRQGSDRLFRLSWRVLWLSLTLDAVRFKTQVHHLFVPQRQDESLIFLRRMALVTLSRETVYCLEHIVLRQQCWSTGLVSFLPLLDRVSTVSPSQHL